jgi:hypothetical protein
MSDENSDEACRSVALHNPLLGRGIKDRYGQSQMVPGMRGASVGRVEGSVRYRHVYAYVGCPR